MVSRRVENMYFFIICRVSKHCIQSQNTNDYYKSPCLSPIRYSFFFFDRRRMPLRPRKQTRQHLYPKEWWRRSDLPRHGTEATKASNPRRYEPKIYPGLQYWKPCILSLHRSSGASLITARRRYVALQVAERRLKCHQGL